MYFWFAPLEVLESIPAVTGREVRGHIKRPFALMHTRIIRLHFYTLDFSFVLRLMSMPCAWNSAVFYFFYFRHLDKDSNAGRDFYSASYCRFLWKWNLYNRNLGRFIGKHDLDLEQEAEIKADFCLFFHNSLTSLTLLSEADDTPDFPGPLRHSLSLAAACRLTSLGDYMLECIRIFQIHPRAGAAVPINWMQSFTSATG